MTENILKGAHFKPTLDSLTLGEVFFHKAEKYADRICQIDADSDQSETYQSVKERSIRLAVNLQRKNLTPQDVVAVCSYNSLNNTIPIIASFYLGSIVVNFDPTLSSRNTAHLLRTVRPRILFVDRESLELMETSLKSANLLPEMVVFGESTFFDLLQPSEDEFSFRPKKVDVKGIALMFFSSGTTGLPKAIAHSHFSLLQIAETMNQWSNNFRRILHHSRMYWISGITLLLLAFVNGGTRIFARVVQGTRIFERIEKYKLTYLFLAPIDTYELTNVPNPEKYDVTSLETLSTGGTTMGNEQQRKLELLFTKAKVFMCYGMSEVGIITMLPPDATKEYLWSKIGSCGNAAKGVSIKIVDPETEEILGPYQKGEIRIKGNGRMVGYYGADSSSGFDSDGFVTSGDIGYFDDEQCLYIVGRMKEMFKYLSWHIVPSSIEFVLMEHPAVQECMVFGVPRGVEGEAPAALVVLRDNHKVEKEEIAKFVEERVSDKERLRGGVTFVSRVPRTPTGKLMRNGVQNLQIS